MPGNLFHGILLAAASCAAFAACHTPLSAPANRDADGAGDAACIPSCAGKKCGEEDGCGAICKTCPTGNQCVRHVSGYTCECDRMCLTDTCGELNGCGQTCQGMCPDADAGYGESSCSNYAGPSGGKFMLACLPKQACVGKLCGETAIGLPSPSDPAPVFSCFGSCPNGRTCSADDPDKFSWSCQ